MAISFGDVVIIIKTIVPLYFSMGLGYICVRWVKIFSQEQTSGIGLFLRTVVIPLMFFKLIATNDIYAINLRLFAADSLQKLVILVVGFCWKIFSKNGSLDWVISLFSLSCMPNTVIIGLPLLDAMYGVDSATIIVQTVVFQGVIWMNVLLTLFEYRTAKLQISKQFPDSSPAAALFIESFRIDSDVFSLDRIKSLQTEESLSDSEKMQEMVRVENRSVLSSSSRFLSFDSAEIMECSGHGSVEQELSAGEARKTKTGLNNINEIGVPSNSKVVPSSDECGGDGDDLDGTEASSATTGEKAAIDVVCEKMEEVPPARSVTKLIFFMALKKFLTNPNTYGSFLGLAWSLLAFKLKIGMPSVVYTSVAALADTSVVVSMFSLGLFMGSQSKLISCRVSETIFAMLCRFVVAPAVMGATSWMFGLRGVVLHVAIIQAALPQAIVSFVYAKEYDVHPEILSTAQVSPPQFDYFLSRNTDRILFFRVALGMLVALPILICYYILMEL